MNFNEKKAWRENVHCIQSKRKSVLCKFRTEQTKAREKREAAERKSRYTNLAKLYRARMPNRNFLFKIISFEWWFAFRLWMKH